MKSVTIRNATALSVRSASLALFTLLAAFAPNASAITVNTVPVGNVGNGNDPATGSLYGGADYAYRIGIYEVTNAQYAEFLNAKAGIDPLGLYQTLMGSHVRGGITRSGSSPDFTYSTRAIMGDKPVNFVSFYDCLRFANWLDNGQGDGDTETGAYTLSSGTSVVRNAGATWFLPSENEWYKAAYYDPRTAGKGGPAGNNNYWLYPSSSDSVPTLAAANSVGDISNPGTNVANYMYGADWNAQDGNITTVGSAGALSASFYGTSDQGGNVWEWNKQPFFGLSHRGLRGGSWQHPADNITASFRYHVGASNDYVTLGFRVASVLGPASVAGDYSDNGVVDAADYTVWRKGLGTTYTQNDYNVWRAHFGQTAGSGSVASANVAVPEPATLSLAVIGVLGLVACARRRHALVAFARTIRNATAWSILTAVVAFSATVDPAHADNFGSGAKTFNIEFVTICLVDRDVHDSHI